MDAEFERLLKSANLPVVENAVREMMDLVFQRKLNKLQLLIMLAAIFVLVRRQIPGEHHKQFRQLFEGMLNAKDFYKSKYEPRIDHDNGSEPFATR